MIFELNHDNIHTALKNYMKEMDILRDNMNFTFEIKNSRKGGKRSRALVEITNVLDRTEEPVTEPVIDDDDVDIPFNMLEPVIEEYVPEIKPHKLFG